MSLLAAIDPTVVTAIVGAILSGGLVGALAIWRKSGPEAEQIVAKTLIEVNEYLRRELDLRDREIEKLRERLRRLRRDFNELESEFQKLTERNGIGNQ